MFSSTKSEDTNYLLGYGDDKKVRCVLCPKDKFDSDINKIMSEWMNEWSDIWLQTLSNSYTWIS